MHNTWVFCGFRSDQAIGQQYNKVTQKHENEFHSVTVGDFIDASFIICPRVSLDCVQISVP